MPHSRRKTGGSSAQATGANTNAANKMRKGLGDFMAGLLLGGDDTARNLCKVGIALLKWNGAGVIVRLVSSP